MIPVETL